MSNQDRTFTRTEVDTLLRGLLPLATSTMGDHIDYGDLWGSTMGLAFTIADTLNYRGESIPGEWEYRRGSPVSIEEIEDYPELLDSDPDYLRYLGNRAMDFRETLIMLGFDY